MKKDYITPRQQVIRLDLQRPLLLPISSGTVGDGEQWSPSMPDPDLFNLPGSSDAALSTLDLPSGL